MSRSSGGTVKCKLCSRIFTNHGWMRERREYHVKYHFCHCPQCASLGQGHPAAGARANPGESREARAVERGG